MGWPKGKPRLPNSGRKKGQPNKSTARAREAIGRFADGNAHKLQTWLDEVANGWERKAVNRQGDVVSLIEGKDPKGAAELYLRAIEYHIPKLGRTELAGADGEKLSVSVQINRTVKDGE